MPSLPRRAAQALAALIVWKSPMPRSHLSAASAVPGKSAHAFTARMCAGSRYLESQRSDALFVDPLAAKLAGSQGLAQPMGDWIMVPRTRFGDDFVVQHYMKARQLEQSEKLFGGVLKPCEIKIVMFGFRVKEKCNQMVWGVCQYQLIVVDNHPEIFVMILFLKHFV